MEARGVKRRRVESPSRRKSTYKSADDEEAEFLVGETQEDGMADDDPLSTFSKETRDLMEKAGLVVPKRQATDEEELVEDEVKVTNQFEPLFYQQKTDVGSRYTMPPEPIHSLPNSYRNFAGRRFLRLFRRSIWRTATIRAISRA